jgi:hypothetical protein
MQAFDYTFDEVVGFLTVDALREGLARVASAPAVLAGTIAVLAWLRGPSDTRNSIAGFLLWAFLSGGILDRYARGRAIRARGFFGACGAHFAAMIRLGVVIVLLNAAIHFAFAPRVGDPIVRMFSLVLLSAVVLAAVYAQIRLVVEDRRSAAGALLGAVRFVRRNPASVALFLFYVAVLWAAARALTAAASGRSERVALAAIAAWIGVLSSVVLALYASGVALFQSRLAHAGYTAAPPIEWPESPAAEAIVNASPSPAP